MKKITITDVVRGFPKIKKEILEGKSFLICEHGNPIAVLSPHHSKGQDQDEAKERPRQDLSEVLERLSELEQSHPDSSSLDLKNDPSMIKIRKRIKNLEEAIESIVHNSSGRTLPEPDADALEELEEEISSLASRVKELEDTIKSMGGNYD